MAREALSARIDGEREPVPAARVDEHLADCADCHAWFDRMTVQAAHLQRLAQPPVAAVAPTAKRRIRGRYPRPDLPRVLLVGVGAVQIVLAAAQAMGFSLGLTHHHGMVTDGHLLNESTAWSLALGVVMIVAGVWPSAAAGLAGVLSVFAGVLTAFIVRDAAAGAVTAERVLTHLPVVLGALLAILVWRRATRPGPEQQAAVTEPEITLPHNASQGRRRGHLWPTDGSAA